MNVISEAIRLAEGLIAVIDEETQRLTGGEEVHSLKSLVDSKIRLTDQLERQLVVLKKSDPAAIQAAGNESHERLAQLLDQLAMTALENGKIVERKQALTEDLLSAVLTDVRRSSGATIMRYGAAGGSIPGHRSAAVSVDARL